MNRIIRNLDILKGNVFVGTRNKSVNNGINVLFTDKFEDQPFLCPFTECKTALFINNDYLFLENNLNNRIFPSKDVKIIVASTIQIRELKIRNEFPKNKLIMIDLNNNQINIPKLRNMCYKLGYGLGYDLF